MSSGWKRIRLGDVCTKIGSGATPRGGSDVYLASGPYALIRSQNVYNDGFHHDGLAFIGEEHASRLVNVEVLADDVLLNITGDSVARACQVDRRVLPARVNQHVAIIRPDPDTLDPRFLRYSLVSRVMQNKMLSWAGSGGTRNALTKGMIESFDVPAPEDANEQRAIAHILGTLDDKIELSRQMNETLEAMAQALFKSWFVDFDPVRAKAEDRNPGLPIPLSDLFPARLVNSELGEIPEGWRASVLGEELTRCGGRIQTGPFGSQLHASDYVADGVPVVMPKDLSRRRVSTLSIARVNINDAERLSRHRLQQGDIVYSRRGDVEQHGLVHRRETGWLCGTGCLLVRPGPKWPSPLWVSFALDHPESRAWIVQHAIGATMPNLNTGILARVPLVVPPDEVLRAFDRLVRPLADKVISADAQTANLVSLRDALLPKLISGEIRVNDSASTVETC